MPEPFGFTGEWQDAGMGLVHLRARWYAPQQGRFTARDSWLGSEEEPQTLAPYTYVHNDSVNWTDPTGHWRWAGSPSPQHVLIEEQHLRRNAGRLKHVHAEF